MAALSPPQVATADEVVERWAGTGAPVTFTGDGVDRYGELFAGVANATLFAQSVPSVHAALSLGVAATPSDVVVPLYLREADAVANFATRERPS